MPWSDLTVRPRTILIGSLLLFGLLGGGTWLIARDAQGRYVQNLSVIMYDRHHEPLSIAHNSRGHYVLQAESLPAPFVDRLLRKEDRFFYYHPGVNPVSTLRALVTYLTDGRARGASTITQQLAKNLLATEGERTIGNKLKETLYALSLEVWYRKDTLLTMYGNTVYLGNQLQGFATASEAYFDTPLRDTTPEQQLALLATLSYPSSRNPWEKDNSEYAAALAARLDPGTSYTAPHTTDAYSLQTATIFELTSAGITCHTSCTTTVDSTLTEALRKILQRHIDAEWDRGVRNGAIAVIDPTRSELIALVGTPDPERTINGGQINMALEPRPIGSTVKPFIYVKGFEEGLRPYTLVDDREYRYPIATGFPLYPKNYDGEYRGEITLHEALSNSLNVPSVKVLEYVGLDPFYAFLEDDLSFSPIQPLDSYQYGIALGGLEMDLLTLTHYFSLFPNYGELRPLRVLQNDHTNFKLPPQSAIPESETIVEPEYTELVTKILSDRLTGVNQFGLKGNLNLTADNYAVKTGTSRDFHDSWVVGYTPDLVVGVWLGNSENTALEQVSGATGAGAVWHDVMEYLFTTPYYHADRQFSLDSVISLPVDGASEWGLTSDQIEAHRTLLTDDRLIVSPHTDDMFALTRDLTIPLRAATTVEWSINGERLGTGSEVSFTPTETGTYELMAIEPTTGEREIITFTVTLELRR